MLTFIPKIYENDKVVLAYYDLSREPHHEIFAFKGLPPGSGSRAARCLEFDRKVEALKGQGCQVHVWGIKYWPQHRAPFYCKSLLEKTDEKART